MWPEQPRGWSDGDVSGVPDEIPPPLLPPPIWTGIPRIAGLPPPPPELRPAPGPRAAWLPLAAILGLSAFLQFYRLGDLQHFAGDEGMLLLAARALVLQHVWPVYGLAFAVGSAHLGPLFDYAIALPLALSGWDPTAAVVLNGLCQVLAVGLCFRLVAGQAGVAAGLAGALVQASLQEVVYYSRFMWPNMLPCCEILILGSLLAARAGRTYHLALLGVWLGVALQLQPTSVLLLPFVGLALLMLRPPLDWRYLALGALALLALFLPAIVHDLTHDLVETRAWLAYSQHGGSGVDRSLGPTLARILVLLQRLVGVHQQPLAAALGVALLAGLAVWAGWGPPARGGLLARLLLLLCGICLAGYLFFGSALRPHYAMPLFPVPALAVGLLAGRTYGGPWHWLHQVRRAAALAVTLGLAATNIQHTWAANFMLDSFQITLRPERSNLITLGQMRDVAAAIDRQAGGRRFNLLFIASDDTPQAYQALLLARGAPLSLHPATLRFLVVQPADWRRAHWPPWARRLAGCPGSEHFAAAVVYILGAPCSDGSGRLATLYQGERGQAAGGPQATTPASERGTR